MGFDREFCRLALLSTGWNENAAAEWLLLNLESLERQRNAADAASAAATPTQITDAATSSTSPGLLV